MGSDTQSRTSTLEEWHRVLGHCNKKDVLRLQNVVAGMNISSKKDFDCGVCATAKQTDNINRTPDSRAKAPMKLIHSDLAGPIDPIVREGFYFTDDF